MFLVSLTLKLLACKVWKLDPPGALPFFIRIYNCLSMGLPIQSEYYVIRKLINVGSRGRVLPPLGHDQRVVIKPGTGNQETGNKK